VSAGARRRAESGGATGAVVDILIQRGEVAEMVVA
jgi:hypothetical protein